VGAVEEIVTKCPGLFVMLFGNVSLDDSAGVDDGVGHQGRSTLYRVSQDSPIWAAVFVDATEVASIALLSHSLVATAWATFRDSRLCSSASM
jgi:hypothetical protein